MTQPSFFRQLVLSAGGAFCRLPVLAFVAFLCAVLPLCGGPGPVAVSTAVAADDAVDDFNVAVKLYQKELWKEAADAFGGFLRKYPRHPKAESARLYLGLAYVEDRKLPEARATLRLFLQNNPDSANAADVKYRIAECSYLLNDLASAGREFTAFIASHPKHELMEWALPYQADTLLQQDKPKEAAALFEQALERFPKGRMVQESQFGLARAYEKLGRDEDALKLYQQLAEVKDSARAPQAQLNLAARYFDLKRYEDAAKAYLELIARFPESSLVPTARLNAGYALYEARKFDEALKQFEAAAAVEEQAGTAAYWRGMTFRSLGQLDKAAEALTAAARLTGETSLGEENLYQLADVRMRQGDFAEAQKLYLAVLQKWPEGVHAAESLHFAAEAAFRRGEAEQAGTLTARFEKDYPDSRLAAYHQLLQGRILAARDGQENLEAAAKLFQQSLDSATSDQNPDAQARARVYLGRVLQKLGRHQDVIDALEPLIEQIAKVQAAGPFSGALVVAGASRLALGEFPQAISYLDGYLKLEPEGAMADQALATRAVAQARLGKFDGAAADLAVLTEKHEASPAVPQTVFSLAELAWSAERWKLAGDWFALLTERQGAEAFQPAAYSGLAWSLYRQDQFAAAAQKFAEVEAKFPQDPARAPEAAYMQGRALEDAGQLKEAAKQLSAAFRSYAPEKPAAPGVEQDLPLRHSYLAGLQAARVLQKLNEAEAADKAYAALLEKFPQPVHLDRLLDEWALMNLQTERYDESDAVFRRLLRDRPDSSLADNARLSLAESDYVAGRIAEASRAFQELQAAEASDNDVRQRALYQLVKIGFEQQDWKAVDRYAAELLKRFPESDYRREMSFHRAEALLNQGDSAAAATILSTLAANPAETATPDAEWFPQVLILLAEARLQQKKYDDVEEIIGRYLAQFPKSPLKYKADEILGRALKNQAKFDAAREAFTRVVESETGRRTPTAAKSQFLIAETWLTQKKYSEAHREYFRVYTLYDFPEWQAPALFQAARCDEARNRWKEAVRLYEDLLREFPNSEFTEQAKERLVVARRKAG